MLKPDIVWRLDKHVRFRRLLDEAVLIHQDRAEALVINDTGISFLELCDGVRKTGEIISGIMSAFDVDEATLLNDLEPFIRELSEQGIIHSEETVSQ